MSHVASGTLASFGPYRVLAKIARGGMGAIHLAAVRQGAGALFVVVKELIAGQEDDEQPQSKAQLFGQESALALRFIHPHIVRTYELGVEGNTPYMVLEYLDGQPLNRIRLKVDGERTRGHQLRVLSEVLDALHYAHELRDERGQPMAIVHRDVSPHNIFVNYADGRARLLDFGIAKAADQLETRAGTVKGKLTYMPPEQARGERLDRRADVFAVGIMLWEMLVGRRLWEGVNEIVALGRLLRGDLPDFRAPFAGGDPALLALVERSLAPDREARFDTALDFKLALDAIRSAYEANVAPAEFGAELSQVFREDRVKRQALINDACANVPLHQLQAMPASLVAALALGSGGGFAAAPNVPIPKLTVGPQPQLSGSAPALSPNLALQPPAPPNAPPTYPGGAAAPGQFGAAPAWGAANNSGGEQLGQVGVGQVGVGQVGASHFGSAAGGPPAPPSQVMPEAAPDDFSARAKWIVAGLFVFCVVVLACAVVLLLLRRNG